MHDFKHYFSTIIFALSLTALTSCSDDNSTTVTPINENSEKTQKIDAVCDSLIQAIPDLTAIVIGVWDEENGFNYEHAYGIADKANNTPANIAMLSRVASITKTFVGTVALQFVDEGKFALDDKITKYLPQYEKYSDVTIKMLLNMTSGIRDYSTEEDFPIYLLTNLNRAATPEELVGLVYDKDFLFTPGTYQHGYSSTNTILLGMILEKVSDAKISDLIQDRIITPLNLQNTFFATSTAMPHSNVLHGYYSYSGLTFDFLTATDPSWAWAAGAMVSDIYDLAIWLQTLVKGSPKLMISDSLQQMRFEGPLDEFGNIYGCGLGNYGNNLWGHGGKLPGYESIAVTDRTKDRTFVIFFNTMNDTRPKDLLKRILEIIDEKAA